MNQERSFASQWRVVTSGEAWDWGEWVRLIPGSQIKRGMYLVGCKYDGGPGDTGLYGDVVVGTETIPPTALLMAVSSGNTGLLWPVRLDPGQAIIARHRHPTAGHRVSVAAVIADTVLDRRKYRPPSPARRKRLEGQRRGWRPRNLWDRAGRSL